MVKQFTFQSEFLPLLKSECKAIQAFYNVSVRHTRPHLTNTEILSLRNLEKEIDALLLQYFSSDNGAFVRLCGRSPKDGDPLDKSQVYNDFQRHLSDVMSETNQDVSLHTKMAAIARTSWLKVPTTSLNSKQCGRFFTVSLCTHI